VKLIRPAAKDRRLQSFARKWFPSDAFQNRGAFLGVFGQAQPLPVCCHEKFPQSVQLSLDLLTECRERNFDNILMMSE
jgi:hypothetical protein